jgi:hypothetical protein
MIEGIENQLIRFRQRAIHVEDDTFEFRAFAPHFSQ